MKRMVLFHKTPAQWSKLEHVEQAFLADLSTLESGSLTDGSEIYSLFHSDIYIRLCETICHHLGIEELHVVQGFSHGEKRNWINGEKIGKYQIDNLSTYWCVDNPKDLLGFMEADVIFSRGNYQKLHYFLCQHSSGNSNPIWIHYPATALMFPHFSLYEQKILSLSEENSNERKKLHKQIRGMAVEHQLTGGEIGVRSDLETMISNFTSLAVARRGKKNVGPYDIVLVDDDSSLNSYEQIYPNSMILKFTKPAYDHPKVLNYKRKYDLLFCGTTLQATKNHMQFIALLNRLDRQLETPIRVAVAGNKGDNPAFSKGLKKQYDNIMIEDFGELTRNLLFELFNNTKSLVILSGRDSNPRIIQEAGICGASIIVADTMSDGLEVLYNHPLLGTVIPTKKMSWFYQRNGNLLFEVNGSFTKKVIAALSAANSPYVVQKIATDLYSLEKTSQLISDQIRLLI